MPVRFSAAFVSVALFSVAIICPAVATPREDRRACWEFYALCTTGAGDAESWRTVCYSDYTVCMNEPEPVTCTSDDRDYCQAQKGRCEARYGGLDIGYAQCAADHEVCFDAHEC